MARDDMVLQLPHLVVHCQDVWLKRLQAPVRLRTAGGEQFLMGYFPRPPEGGQALLPYARHLQGALEAWSAPGGTVGTAGALRPRAGLWHGGSPLPGAWGTILQPVPAHAI